jgi:hypothetical protein
MSEVKRNDSRSIDMYSDYIEKNGLVPQGKLKLSSATPGKKLVRGVGDISHIPSFSSPNNIRLSSGFGMESPSDMGSATFGDDSGSDHLLGNPGDPDLNNNDQEEECPVCHGTGKLPTNQDEDDGNLDGSDDLGGDLGNTSHMSPLDSGFGAPHNPSHSFASTKRSRIAQAKFKRM